jgi:hypothetical protein
MLEESHKISNTLPPLDDEGHVNMIMEHIVAAWEKKLRNKVLLEYLILWNDLPLEDVATDGKIILQYPRLQLLWDEAIQGGGTITSWEDYAIVTSLEEMPTFIPTMKKMNYGSLDWS